MRRRTELAAALRTPTTGSRSAWETRLKLRLKRSEPIAAATASRSGASPRRYRASSAAITG
jgi:hypothetical protein